MAFYWERGCGGMAKLSYELADKMIIAPPGEKTKNISLANTHQSLLKLVSIISLVFTDIIGLAAALVLSFQIRIHILPKLFPVFPAAVPPELMGKAWWAAAIMVLCIAYEGLYTKKLSFWRETKRLISAVTLAFVLMLAAVSLAKLSGEVSRTVVVTGYIISLFTMPLARYLGKYILYKLGIWKEPLIILGTGETAKAVADALMNDWYLGYCVRGFLSSQAEEKAVKMSGKEYPVCGVVKDAAKILSSTRTRHVIIAQPELAASEIVSLTNQLQPYTRSVLVVPDLFGIPVVSGEADYFFDEQILAFRTKNNLASRINIITKRLFDIVVGSVILVLALPIMLLIALVIRIDSKGPAIFSGNRIGRHGKEFKCYKFRTMFLNNEEILEEYLKKNPKAREEWEKYAKIKGDDPRVTRVGRFLRKLSLDELPQLINVIKGDMSLVGARPYLPRERKEMDEFAETILLANPGITGLWQVNGRNEIDFEGRVRMEAWYVRNWSLWLDISLLFRTVGVVLGRKGAY